MVLADADSVCWIAATSSFDAHERRQTYPLYDSDIEPSFVVEFNALPFSPLICAFNPAPYPSLISGCANCISYLYPSEAGTIEGPRNGQLRVIEVI